MLNVLLESRAPRPRRMGSTVASALVHAVVVAGAVSVTMPGPASARAGDAPRPAIDYMVTPKPYPAPRARQRETPPANRHGVVFPTIAAPDVVPVGLPPIDVGPVIPADEVVIGAPGVRTASPMGDIVAGAPIDERSVDRAPRLLGRAPEPSYPASLREAGVQGRVVVQFVVDTLGRAELDGLHVMESPHALFSESVRAALARYRFSVGEAAGRKVRTRVQIPFEFTLAPSRR